MIIEKIWLEGLTVFAFALLNQSFVLDVLVTGFAVEPRPRIKKKKKIKKKCQQLLWCDVSEKEEQTAWLRRLTERWRSPECLRRSWPLAGLSISYCPPRPHPWSLSPAAAALVSWSTTCERKWQPWYRCLDHIHP